MKIAIDARSSTLHQGTGIGTYANNFISEILSIDTNDEFTLFCSENLIRNFIKKILI